MGNTWTNGTIYFGAYSPFVLRYLTGSEMPRHPASAKRVKFLHTRATGVSTSEAQFLAQISEGLDEFQPEAVGVENPSPPVGVGSEIMKMVEAGGGAAAHLSV